MSAASEIGLPEALERAASALPGDADAIRPANGDPVQLVSLLGAEGAIRVLRWLLENEPGVGGELADAWVDAGGDALDPVRGVDPAGLPKAARKALRRAHHRLRSRGESAPTPVAREVVAKLPKIEEEIDEGLLSPVDPRGSRIAYLIESNPSGGARLFVLVLDEVRGVVALDVFNAGRSKVKQFVRDSTRRNDYPVVAAAPDAVRALVARIVGYQPSDRPLPRAFSEWRSRLVRPAGAAQTPGEIVREALGGRVEADAAALAQAAKLVTDEKLGPWPPDSELLEPIAQKIRDAATGVVIVSGAARKEQIHAAFDESIEGIFDPEFARRTAERFEESAYVFWKHDQESEALTCLAAADAFRDQAPLGNPIARAMLEVVLAPVLKSAEEEPQEPAAEEGQESLLVRP